MVSAAPNKYGNREFLCAKTGLGSLTAKIPLAMPTIRHVFAFTDRAPYGQSSAGRVSREEVARTAIRPTN